MKKNYQKPEMTLVCIQHQGMICSSLQSVHSDSTGIGYNGGGYGDARSRGNGGWDDDE